ncbi:MAG: glucose 1-dehydrogenase [Alphaproteobacteria bacterium]|nr:glucose 1-dehydrogenase [Alphaproteobacteria bacterium]
MAGWTERFGLAGRWAMVTGASKGIGLEICKVLADAGADIVAVGRDNKGLEEARASVQRASRECLVVEADLATIEGCNQATRDALAHAGTIDILVNNAGIALIDPLIEATAARWDETMAINLRAPFLLAQAVVPSMIAKRAGKIINISSQAGVVGLEQHGAYSASKGGLNMLTKVMCIEWSKHNIQCNAVCPTIVLTPMGKQVWGDRSKSQPMLDKTPLGRFGQPVEVADLVLFLSSSASDLITGECVLIDGGFTSM